MQLVFTIEEFRLLVHILREHSDNDSSPETSLLRAATALLQKVLARDFRFSIDELEDLEEILKIEEQKVHGGNDATCTPEQVHNTELLEHLLDRVTEACAMG